MNYSIPFCSKPPSKDSGSYVYSFTVDSELVYIGKGKRRRPWDHITNAKAVIAGRYKGKMTVFLRRLVAAMKRRAVIEITILRDRMTEDEALAFEVEAIAARGLENLWNSTEGGDGLTSAVAKELNNRPETKAKNSAGVRKAFEDPDVKRRHAEGLKAANEADPTINDRRTKSCKASWTPDRRAAKSEWAKQRLAENPELVEEMRERSKANMTPEQLKVMQEGHKVQTDAEKAKRSATMKARWQDPSSKLHNRKPREYDPDKQAAQAQASKNRWADPEYKARLAAKISATLKARNAEKRTT